jgi:hypothetical protein
MAEIASSGEADLIAVSITDVPTTWPDLARSLADSVPTLGLPVAVYCASRDADVVNMAALNAARIPTYRATRDLAPGAGRARPTRRSDGRSCCLMYRMFRFSSAVFAR